MCAASGRTTRIARALRPSADNSKPIIRTSPKCRADARALETASPNHTLTSIRALRLRALRTQFLVSALTLFKRSFRMTIVRYELWLLVGRLQQPLDRALVAVADSATVSWIPHVVVHEEADRFVDTADLPSVEGKDIEATADKVGLTIKGEH